MNKQYSRKTGKLITRTVNISSPEYAYDENGELIELAPMIESLSKIVNHSAENLLNQIWTNQRVEEISKSTASHAWVATERAYKDLDLGLGDIHTSSRVKRLIYERVGRVLRSKAHGLKLCQAVLDNQRSEFEKTEWRNMKRTVNKSAGKTPYEIIASPLLRTEIVNLDAVDSQCCEIEDERTLRILLPTCAQPTKNDWIRVRVPLEINPTQLKKFKDWGMKKPTIRVDSKGITFQTPLETEAPVIPKSSERVFALDWGVRRLLTGSVLWRDADAVRTDGKPYYFDATGCLLNLDLTRNQGRIINSKMARIKRLLENRSSKWLDFILTRHQIEADHQWAHTRNLNNQLACHAANWIVDQAVSLGADTVAVEDLRTLEARSLGRITNQRVSQSVRGKIYDRLVDRCAEAGLKLTRVNPHGTSKYCSRCSRESKFQHSPSVKSGRANWIVCSCSRSSDRDHSAAERIGSRALNKKTPSVRITRSKKPTPLKPLILLTKSKRSSKRSTCPSSVSRAFAPEFSSRVMDEHHAKQYSSSLVRSRSDARLDSFRHHAHSTRVRYEDHGIQSASNSSKTKEYLRT